MDKAKPFGISKREVWEAFKKVKANRGAAGVDGQSITAFEADLSNNLYKPWNRLASGSYFPPPVRRVMIPKAGGAGERPLGIPTVVDVFLVRWARRKFKRLRWRPQGARDWLARVCLANPKLFAHWRFVNVKGRTSGAV